MENWRRAAGLEAVPPNVVISGVPGLASIDCLRPWPWQYKPAHLWGGHVHFAIFIFSILALANHNITTTATTTPPLITPSVSASQFCHTPPHTAYFIRSHTTTSPPAS